MEVVSYFHWSQTALGITIACVGVLLVVILLCILSRMKLCLKFLVIIPIVIELSLIAFAPIKIVISEKDFKVKMVVLSISIPRQAIKECSILSQEYVQDSKRHFGSFGFCGFLGNYKSVDKSSYTLCATDLNQLFMLELMNGEKYVFSSPDRENIINNFEK